MSNVTAFGVDENAIAVPNLGDQRTALLGVVFTETPSRFCFIRSLTAFASGGIVCDSPLRKKVGLRKSSLVANGKLLTTKAQSSTKMSDFLTMSKVCAEHTLVATLTARAA